MSKAKENGDIFSGSGFISQAMNQGTNGADVKHKDD
jgi:hypothetical protein